MVHLQQIKEQRTSGKGQLATITYEALKYLESSGCQTQIPEKIRKCLSALAPYNLKKTEKLMIINTPPTTELEIQLIVENSEERLTDAHVNEILNIINVHLGIPKEK